MINIDAIATAIYTKPWALAAQCTLFTMPLVDSAFCTPWDSKMCQLSCWV